MRAAFGFLTLVGGAAAPSRRTTLWFGPVGAVIGFLVGLAWWGADEIWTPLVAAVVAVAVDAAVTGLLHLDGLADAADGLLPPIGRERRLAVMATPDVGAFGVVVVVTVLALRIAALASLTPDPLLIGGLWAGARAAMALTVARVPYARATGGLASAFGARPIGGGGRETLPPPAPPTVSVGALAGGTALVVVAIGWGSGSAAFLTLIGGFVVVVALAVRRIGGFTGDVLGAAGVVGETLGLLAASAQW